MMTLDQMKKRDKIKKINALQNGPVAEFYAENGDRLVADMKYDRGVPQGMQPVEEGVFLKHRQAEAAKHDPARYQEPPPAPKFAFCRPGWQCVDNAAIMP